MSRVDQKSKPKRKACGSPENSYIQIKWRSEQSYILTPLYAWTFAPVQTVPTDAVISLVVTVTQSHAETFKAT